MPGAICLTALQTRPDGWPRGSHRAGPMHDAPHEALSASARVDATHLRHTPFLVAAVRGRGQWPHRALEVDAGS